MHAARGSVAVLDGAGFGEPATKRAAEALAKWGARRPTLVVLAAEEVGGAEELSQHPRVTVLRRRRVGVADVIGHASLVVSQSGARDLLEQAQPT